MKINLEEVESTLLQRKVDPTKVREVITDLEKIVEELAEERKANAADKPKWEHVIVLNDPDGLLKDKEIAGWVVQQEEGGDANTIIKKIQEAAGEQNGAAKRKKSQLTTLKEMFEGLKPKFLKEKKVKIKTKELTRVIVV